MFSPTDQMWYSRYLHFDVIQFTEFNLLRHSVARGEDSIALTQIACVDCGTRHQDLLFSCQLQPTCVEVSVGVNLDDGYYFCAVNRTFRASNRGIANSWSCTNWRSWGVRK